MVVISRLFYFNELSKFKFHLKKKRMSVCEIVYELLNPVFLTSLLQLKNKKPVKETQVCENLQP